MARKKAGEQETESRTEFEERTEAFPHAEPINYFGTDFDVHGLVRRLNDGDIVVPSFDPAATVASDLSGFQRGFIWKKYQMDRFIESLLLGYPVPGLFFVQQADRKLLVLDGQQRMRTLQAFYRGTMDNGQSFVLEDVGNAHKGIRYAALSDEDRRTLDNTFIHATIVKYNSEQDGDDAVYQLFERLNTGGTNLYPHEIRVALYNGAFVELIRNLNDDSSWRLLYGERSTRLKDHELILRFIAFQESVDQYERPLRGFLNDFARAHRQLEGLDKQAISAEFRTVCLSIVDGIGKRAFRIKSVINTALTDAVMVGVARRLRKGRIRNLKDLGTAFETLVKREDFLSAITRATADEDRVKQRIRLSTEAFNKVS